MISNNFTLIHPPPTIHSHLLHKNNVLTDFIPSTSYYELYPIGFLTISEYLKRRGIETKIINLANILLSSPNGERLLEKFLGRINLGIVGIDFHWLVHAGGAIELARLIKSLHPYSVVIVGGFSATYFVDELLNYPWIDYVVLGDIVHEPLFKLITAIRKKRLPQDIENIAYREKGKIIKNKIICADTLDELNYDYGFILRKVNIFNFRFYNPYHQFSSYPIFHLPTIIGCTYNCIFCGGSKYSYKQVLKRDRPAFFSVEKLTDTLESIARLAKVAIFLSGDIMQTGELYTTKFFHKIKKKNIKNTLIFELFKPWDYNILKLLNNSVDNFILQISPQTHSEEIRHKFGREFSNASLENMLIYALETSAKRIDLFFTIGLPGQDYASIKETLKYIDYLYRNFKDKLRVYLVPLAPFIDPGSILYEKPNQFNYKIFYKRLFEYKDILLYPTWKYHLSYETDRLTRDDIVNLTYESLIKLKEIEYAHNIIPYKMLTKVIKQLQEEQNFMQSWDNMLKGMSYPETGYIKNIGKRYLKDEFLSFSKKTLYRLIIKRLFGCF